MLSRSSDHMMESAGIVQIGASDIRPRFANCHLGRAKPREKMVDLHQTWIFTLEVR